MCFRVCMCRHVFVCCSGRWVFRCPLPVHVLTDCEKRNRATRSDETSGENLLYVAQSLITSFHVS